MSYSHLPALLCQGRACRSSGKTPLEDESFACGTEIKPSIFWVQSSTYSNSHRTLQTPFALFHGNRELKVNWFLTPNPSPTTPRPVLWRCHCHCSSFTSSAQPIHATVRAVLVAGLCEIGSAPSLQGYLEALQRSSKRTNTGCGCCWYRIGLVIYVFIPTRYVIYLFMSRVCLRSQSRTSDLPVLHWCVLWGS